MRKKKFTVYGISDLHGNLLDVEYFGNGGDLLCICGDILPLDIQSDDLKSVAWFYSEFVPWCNSLPFDKIIMVFGNHDFLGEHIYKKYGDYNSFFGLYGDYMSKIVILLDNVYEYKGLKIYGTSWCPELSAWAYYKNSSELQEKFSKLPSYCDIILSHCPIKGMVGTVLQNGNWNFMRDFGCNELTDALNGYVGQWFLCGHVHSGYHTPYQFGNINVVNVSVLNENYEVAYSPLKFEITPLNIDK